MYLYLISNGSGQVKIGITKSPVRRLKTLQTGNANKLRLHLLVEGDRFMEKRIHKLLIGERSREKGEWFEINDPSDISWLCKYIVGLSLKRFNENQEKI